MLKMRLLTFLIRCFLSSGHLPHRLVVVQWKNHQCNELHWCVCSVFKCNKERSDYSAVQVPPFWKASEGGEKMSRRKTSQMPMNQVMSWNNRETSIKYFEYSICRWTNPSNEETGGIDKQKTIEAHWVKLEFLLYKYFKKQRFRLYLKLIMYKWVCFIVGINWQ